jgi:ADP-heptose:LPS heptosyltransferase
MIPARAQIPGRSPAERKTTRRIAVIRALHLGDLLLAVPALRAIRRGFPMAEITLIGLRWSAEFARRFHQYVDRWREFPGYPGLLEVDVDPERTREFLKAERRYGYDLVLALHGSGPASNQFAVDLQGRHTVGFYVDTPPNGFSFGAPYPISLHEIRRNLALVRLLGVADEDVRLEFPALPSDDQCLRDALPPEGLSGNPIVVLHPGAHSPARRWPVERFAAVGDALATRFGATIVITGGPGETPIAAALADRMRSRPINLAERTPLGGLAALLRHADLVIANDTGPAHLAVALDRPSVTIFGPADRARWAPLDATRHRTAYQSVACTPCPHWDCPIDHRCLRWLEPAQVLSLAEELLRSASSNGPHA